MRSKTHLSNSYRNNSTKILLTTLLSFIVLSASAAVYNSDGTVQNIQAIHNNQAVDGDTIMIPAGTFSWTARLNITKGITLRGNTVVTGAGTSGATAQDNTILRDDVTQRNGLIFMNIPAGKVAHITKLTFDKGATVTTGGQGEQGFIIVDSSDYENSKGNRISYCHFKPGTLYATHMRVVNGYGVIDHCLFERQATGDNKYNFIIDQFNQTAVNNPIRQLYGGFGNPVWALPPRFGTDNFFFIESCTITRENNGFNSDGNEGMRYVLRHSYVHRGNWADHGTEGGQSRGHRAREVYNNTFDFTGGTSQPIMGFRSGTGLIHDNIRTGVAPANNNISTTSNYRTFPARFTAVYGMSDGTSIWDMNVTGVSSPDGDWPTLNKSHQIFAPGDPGMPFKLGANGITTGTADCASPDPIKGCTTLSGGTGCEEGGTCATQATFTDSSRTGANAWTPDQWVGYSIRNLDCSICNRGSNPPSDAPASGSYIISNTANTITYAYYNGTDVNKQHLFFAEGDRYQIHRVIEVMDASGQGKTEVITLPSNNNPINTTTGTASYAHSVIEPIMGWNNKYGTTALKVGESGPSSKECGASDPGTDHCNIIGNLGINLTWPNPPLDRVTDYYNAARNGVAYTGPFCYPHPLVQELDGVPCTENCTNCTDVPSPSPSPSPTLSPSPTVTTNPATNIASFAAALNGSVNPRGSTTTVYFQWGTTTSYGHITSTQTQTGNTSRPITANISGLSANRLYHFRIVATNGGGTSFGSDRTFTTLSATGPPAVTTNPATNITTSSARLNGTLNPHGLTTTVRFQWGATTSYGHTTPMQTQTGNTYRNITANISGLSASHFYHFRIVATNSAGTRFGIDRTFNTP